MFSPNFEIFKLCKGYLELNCDTIRLREKENSLAPFTVYLTKDENNNYRFSDNEFSIKCILKEEAVSKFLSANTDYNNLDKLCSKNIL
jgi:hypothetical protein